jgi:outer membrane protein OmpA-like peptidoglycan-associated protein
VEQEIVLSQQVQFEVGTAVLRPESDFVLSEVARVLGEHPEIELVEVQGHTDESGTPDLNRRLGQERADRVVAWLAAHGVGRERLSPKGYGSDRPIADNATDEGRQKNRRVEFRVLRMRVK